MFNNAALLTWRIGLTKLQLFHHNVSTVKTIITGMRPFKPGTILLIVSTPVDLLTSVALKFSRLPKSQVLGTGTFLDSVRLRGLIADKLGVCVGISVVTHVRHANLSIRLP